MKTNELHFDYPKSLVATERKPPSRVMQVRDGRPQEVSVRGVLNEIAPEDVLVINTTKVIPARVFAEQGLEILFIEDLGENLWKVLCPARRWPKGTRLDLPGGVQLELANGGLPQTVKTSKPLSLDYFEAHGDWPLPPYIQEARGQRVSRVEDAEMYQTAWAQDFGSLAAPTASFHFSNEDLDKVRSRGASIVEVTLHVGLGTFLPVHSDDLKDHKMHFEKVHLSKKSWQDIQNARSQGGRVWAMGSTVTRALESQALGHLEESSEGFSGDTDLFITPGFDFKVVDVLMTNFHQPKTTLLAMVMAFGGIEAVRACYSWAIERKFRLFSYGDLSVWHK